MTKCIEAREARRGFGDLMDSVHYGGQTVIIEHSGRPMVAIIPVEMYQQFIAQWEARSQTPGNGQLWPPEVPSPDVA
jgi:prevent-host-death family protein